MTTTPDPAHGHAIDAHRLAAGLDAQDAAQVYATLALAEEQRTANLIATLGLAAETGGRIDPDVLSTITTRLGIGGSVGRR